MGTDPHPVAFAYGYKVVTYIHTYKPVVKPATDCYWTGDMPPNTSFIVRSKGPRAQ